MHSEALYAPQETSSTTPKSHKVPQPSLTRPVQTASGLSNRYSRKRAYTSATSIGQQADKKLSTHSEFPYNKWFIRPENRLKSGGVTEQSQANCKWEVRQTIRSTSRCTGSGKWTRSVPSGCVKTVGWRCCSSYPVTTYGS